MTLVLVDGSNVARSAAWGDASGLADVIDLRRRLVDAVCGWAAEGGRPCLVTFDGAGPWRPGSIQVTDLVEVRGSGPDTGDDVIEREAAACARDGLVHWLVTDDAAVRAVAGARAERVLSTQDFVAELGGSDSIVDAPSMEPPSTRLSGRLDARTLAKLERMRRGES